MFNFLSKCTIVGDIPLTERVCNWSSFSMGKSLPGTIYVEQIINCNMEFEITSSGLSKRLKWVC